jgi:hypothetical protein
MPTKKGKSNSSPTKKRSQKTPSKTASNAPKITMNDPLPFPGEQILPVVDTILLKNSNKEAKKSGIEEPWKQGIPKDMEKDDEIYISCDLEESDEPNSYRARCIYANKQTGYWVIHYYNYLERPTTDPNIQELTDNDTDGIFFVRQISQQKPKRKVNELLESSAMIMDTMVISMETMERKIDENKEIMTHMAKNVQDIDSNVGDIKKATSLENIGKKLKELIARLESNQQRSRARIENQQRKEISTTLMYHPNVNEHEPQQDWTQHTQYPSQIINRQAIIKNIPYDEQETEIDLSRIIDEIIKQKKLDHYLGEGRKNPIAIEKSDYSAKRLIKPNIEQDSKTTPIILVTFRTSQQKTNFIRARPEHKQLLKVREVVKNNREISAEEKEQTIYISENLTDDKRYLFYLARQKKKEINYKYCWTTNNTIWMKKLDDSRPIRIDDESDLDKLNES